MRFVILFLSFIFIFSHALAFQGMGPGPGGKGYTSGGGGGTPPTYVNSASEYGALLASYTPAASGNVLVLCASGVSTLAATTVTTVPAITFTAMSNYGSGSTFARCYWGVVGSTSSHSVELTGTIPNDPGFVLYELSGVNTSTRTDGEAGAVTTNSTTFSSGTVTTTGATMLIGHTSDAANTSAITWGSGWIERAEELSHVHGGATNSQASAGTFSANGTRPSAATQVTVVVAMKGN